MFSGIYEYMFGSEDSNDSCSSNSSMESTSVNYDNSRLEEDWLYVQNAVSGRSSPVFVALPELRDIDELSFASKKAEAVPEPDYATVLRLAELKKARARNAQKLQLEKALFADVLPSASAVKAKSSKVKKSSGTLGVINHVNDAKTKRSKKSGKASSGMNNDRKVNNID